MPAVKYGTQKIQFEHVLDKALKHAYITVDFYDGVMLKSPPISEIKAKEAVYKKGKWILDKLKLVERLPQGKIITGSRLLYLGKRYYVDVIQDAGTRNATVKFTHSKFEIRVNPNLPEREPAIKDALEKFARDKAIIKITPRIKKWSQTTGLTPTDLKFRKLDKRWGSCTKANEVIINFDAVKLPFTLIDYIVVHELVHIKHRDHSKEFYKEIAKFIPEWKLLDEKLCGMKL
ncbi:M48 family metallopeptidase [Desulfobacula sp.]